MIFFSENNGFFDSEIHGDSIPADAVEISDEMYFSLMNGQCSGKIISCDKNGKPCLIDPAPPSNEQIAKNFLATIQTFIDNAVRERDYDSMISLASYADSTNPVFRQEAIAAIEWRDHVWEIAYAIYENIKSGKRTVTTVETLINELPRLKWPKK